MTKIKETLDIKNIPIEMKNCPTWICWKKEERKGRITKIPINPFDSEYGDVTNSNKWTTLENAIEACDKYRLDGIGFVFSKEYNIVGIDIDHCINEDGKLNDLAREILNKLNTYSELSPSKTGIHIICKGHLPGAGKNNRELGLEMYDEKRFFTFTGDIYSENCIVAERTKELSEIYDKYLNYDKKDKITKQEINIDIYENKMISDNVIIEKAFNSKNGYKFRSLYNGNWKENYKSQSDADQAFCNMLAFWTAKDKYMMDSIFRKSGLYRDKWDKRHYGNGKTYGEGTIEKAISSCSRVYDGVKDLRDKFIGGKAHSSCSVESKAIKEFKEALPEWYVENNGKVTFIPGLLAKYLSESIPAIYTGNKLYLYKDGVYTELATEEALRTVQEQLIDRYSKSAYVKDVFELWKNKIYMNINKLNSEKDKHIINFKNGLYDVNEKRFLEHTPDLLTTIQLNCSYNPNATCDNFLKFMNEILPADCIKLSQELLGYLLVPFTAAQKAFLLYGPPRTGKSTFIRVVESLIGKEHISNVALQDLDSRFKTALLFGKMVNIFADLPSKPIQDSGVFKALTGEDMLIGEHKFGNPFSFNNKARLLFSCNTLPANYADRTDAFYRRLIILPFMHQVSGESIDTKLSEKLANEKEGIVQWALEGLYRLMSNDFRFTETTETKAIIEEYKIESDTVLWFIQNYCNLDSESTTSSVILYDAYRNTCISNGLGAVSQIKFNKSIEANYSKVITKTKDVNTRRAIFKGISLIQ